MLGADGLSNVVALLVPQGLEDCALDMLSSWSNSSVLAPEPEQEAMQSDTSATKVQPEIPPPLPVQHKTLALRSLPQADCPPEYRLGNVGTHTIVVAHGMTPGVRSSEMLQ